MRLSRTSGLHLQAVKVTVARGLVVAYLQGVGDGGESALAQIGVPSRVPTADELPQLDLSRFTTVVVGPRASEAHPDLSGQRERLLDFARLGRGTYVYSAVTFFEQIPAGMSGALRLFVHLLSAGCGEAWGAESRRLSAVGSSPHPAVR